ncbi:MAG TPA: DUF72 domain-containing protein [Ilumatobacteraceae bacterium]
MTGRMLVGCAMWANRGWVGRYFPSTTRPGDELAQYVQWCTAVEGNTTFYALPPIDTVRRWADVAPESFRFVFKLPRSITHEQRLRNTDAELAQFVRLLEPLGARCGPLTVQLPPSFGPGDLGLLGAFLRRAPIDVRWAVEVRHPGFFDGGKAQSALDRMLLDVSAERVILDTRPLFSAPPTDEAERVSWSKKPRLPVVVQALTESPIVRIVGRMSEAETIAGWQPWLPVLTSWLDEGRTPIVFVHTPDDIAALALARRLHEEVTRAGHQLEPLPTLPADDAVQGSLFE